MHVFPQENNSQFCSNIMTPGALLIILDIAILLLVVTQAVA